MAVMKEAFFGTPYITSRIGRKEMKFANYSARFRSATKISLHIQYSPTLSRQGSPY